MVLGPIETWTAATLDELVAGQWQESIVLEFKRDLAPQRSDRKEAAKDISAFANTSGGWLVYGIDEQPNASGIKVAAAVTPISDANAAQRLDDIVAEAIVPPLRYRSKTIAYGNGACVVLRIEPSASALHMVQAYDEFRYYRRTERAARPMSEPEVRQALDQIARRDADGDRCARELFERVSDKYPSPHGWVALSTAIGGELIDPRRVRDATIKKYLHHEYASHGRIEDVGFRAVLGEYAYDFGVTRDGSTWMKWPLDGISGDFRPFVLVEHVVRLSAFATELWTECSVNPIAPRLALSLHTDRDLKVYDGTDRYRALIYNQSKWLSFVVSRGDLQDGERLSIARTIADRVYQVLGASHCPFFGDDGSVKAHLQNDFRKLPL